MLTNTLTGRKEVIIPQKADSITLYVCGITPYDNAHIGHGRCYVTFDFLYRLLNFLGYQVTYCRNFTDIDDKLIQRSMKEYNDPMRYSEVADRYIAAFTQDMRALGCLPPTYEPRVTENISEIISFIQGLIDKGSAYEVGGDVYFDINADPHYGKLSKRHIDEMIAGARVMVSEKKRNPLDFALWKNEPRGTFWESPWGWGRPGWHIECSVMAQRYLGETIDIHGGGMDLIFPHHENEIAQSETLHERPFVRTWVHNAFVRINQEKMSKSLGNFFTLQDIFAQYEPMVVRFYFLQHHYRNPLDFNFDDLTAACKTYQRIIAVLGDDPTSTKKPSAASLQHPLVREMINFLCDDLNVAGMLGLVFEHVAQIRDDKELQKQVRYIFINLLGLTLEPLAEKEVVITAEIQALLDAREEARLHKNWARADQLREQLRMLGYEVKDKKVQ